MPLYRRRAVRHRLGQDAGHARPYPAVPASGRRGGQTAEQRHPGDAERAVVGAAQARTAGEQPARPAVLRRGRGGPAGAGGDH